MIKNPEILEKFEIEYEQNINHTYLEKLKIFENMLIYKNTIKPDEDHLENLDEK